MRKSCIGEIHGRDGHIMISYDDEYNLKRMDFGGLWED